MKMKILHGGRLGRELAYEFDVDIVPRIDDFVTVDELSRRVLNVFHRFDTKTKEHCVEVVTEEFWEIT